MSVMQQLPPRTFLSAQVENAYNISLLNVKASEHYIRYHHTSYTQMRSSLLRNNTRGVGKILDDPPFAYRNEVSPEEEVYIMESYSNIDRLDNSSKKVNQAQKLQNYWDIRSTEVSLPIHAAGKVYTHSAFEALTIQCFYRPS